MVYEKLFSESIEKLGDDWVDKVKPQKMKLAHYTLYDVEKKNPLFEKTVYVGVHSGLIAVTQLTSTDQESMENDLLIKEPIADVVMHYASCAKEAGLDGVVCSPLEAGKVHDRCGAGFVTVTPGVRFADGDIGDQKRVMTPAAAKEIGSDYIVVGRPITAA